jgi:RNA recognition motif-containing protein
MLLYGMEKTRTDSTMEDEEELLAAAANWAGATNSENGDQSDEEGSEEEDSEQYDIAFPPATFTSTTLPREKKYSLHLTQLSYEATDYDIRNLFLGKGCLVTSVRLVYNKPECQFRGVAFVDVQDEDSYQRALKLHRTYHLGRRINVRPTLIKEQLGKIADATKERVHNLITEQQQQQQETGAGGAPEPTKTKKEKPAFKSGSNDSNSKNKVSVKKKNKSLDKPKKKRTTVKAHPSGEDRKLTKKERNRKAAILLQKKRMRSKKK